MSEAWPEIVATTARHMAATWGMEQGALLGLVRREIGECPPTHDMEALVSHINAAFHRARNSYAGATFWLGGEAAYD